MFDLVDDLEATPGQLVDLGCGPGTLLNRARQRWPHAQLAGIDLDPVLLRLARSTLGGTAQLIESDLRRANDVDLAPASVDTVVSMTALHWLSEEDLPQLSQWLAAVVRRGGVFVDYDTMELAPTVPRLKQAAHALRARLRDDALDEPDSESWDQWWNALRLEPALAAEFAERTRRFAFRQTANAGLSLESLRTALLEAGFAEVAPLSQVADRHLLVAVR
ncbi:class I SAM-dependent methyltransferase [Nocardioidaceae bacterium SCSIO 66511]|nr:class I SAM-dependent methyltransferase [Nocardioidaceae bacterium SCSIO 66511]